MTGTFGGVDFLHSVLGEATDHFAQSEVDELDIALKSAQDGAARGGDGSRGLLGSSTRDFVGLVGQLPGMGGGFAAEARDLQARSAAQEEQNRAEGGTVIPAPTSMPSRPSARFTRFCMPSPSAPLLLYGEWGQLPSRFSLTPISPGPSVTGLSRPLTLPSRKFRGWRSSLSTSPRR